MHQFFMGNLFYSFIIRFWCGRGEGEYGSLLAKKLANQCKNKNNSHDYNSNF